MTDQERIEKLRNDLNFWKLKWSEMYIEVMKANKGIARLQKKLKRLQEMKEGE